MRLCLRAQGGNVIQRHSEPDCAGDIGRSRFKATGDSAKRRSRKINRLYHIAAALIRRHFFQNFGARIKHADSRGTANFVPGKNKKIASDILHVQREMRRRLRGIDKGERSGGMRGSTNFFYGINGSERVRSLRNTDDFCFFRNQTFQRGNVERTVITHRRNDNFCARAPGNELPRHDVGVMLHFGQQNFVAGAKICAAPTCRHEVYRFRCATRKNAFPRFTRIQENGNAFPRTFEIRRRLLAQPIKPAVNVCVAFCIEITDGINYTLRFLSRCRAVEINRRRILPQKRERGTNFFDIKRHILGESNAYAKL